MTLFLCETEGKSLSLLCKTTWQIEENDISFSLTVCLQKRTFIIKGIE